VTSLILVALLGSFFLQPPVLAFSYSEAVKHFEYDQSAPLNVKQISVRHVGGASVHDIAYAGARGAPVPAYLVVPEGKGKFAAVIWGHWMMPHSPTANRSEFLQEAVALTRAGVVSLLIDAPYIRPGFKTDAAPLSAQGPDVLAQQVVDLRRGLDLLLARSDVDAHRVGFVGHSFDAGCGAALDAVDKRFAAFVFMGDPESTRGFVLESTLPALVELRKSVSRERLEQYLDIYSWADAMTYARRLGPAPSFFQYGTHDPFTPVALASQYFRAASGPKQIKFYDAGHALNREARRDRFEFLQKHLALGSLPLGVLARIPPTK
jgi:dienelactone hydrolase